MQSDKDYTFSEFKEALRNFEENEKVMSNNANGRVMMNAGHHNGGNRIICHHCQGEGHKSNACPKKAKYCSNCKTNTHKTADCRNKNKNRNNAHSAKAASSASNISFNFMVNDNAEVDKEEVCDTSVVVESEKVEKVETEVYVDTSAEGFEPELAENDSQMACQSVNTESKDTLVDSGCTAHSFNDESVFTEFDPSFQPENHSLTLADGTVCSGMAEKRGKVEVTFTSEKGDEHNVTLNDVLYIPTYPQNMFSVSKANLQNASVVFMPNSAHLIAPDGTKFNIKKERGLFWLKTRIRRRKSHDSVASVSVRDLRNWHSTLGHCNKADILKLESLVDGMKIAEKGELSCTPCILGKHTNNINKSPSERAKSPLEMVSSDVCGPITPASPDGFRWVISFIDNYSGFIFVYFMKNKSDATQALRKFIADISPFGRIKSLLNLATEADLVKLRSDGGGEYMGTEFKSVLVDNHIKHEQSAPSSPHQNGVAERTWRTLFDMGRCMLLESQLPKSLWPYAIIGPPPGVELSKAVKSRQKPS